MTRKFPLLWFVIIPAIITALMPRKTEACPPSALAAHAKPKILLIEDDRQLREIISLNLQREGYEVLEAADGRTGLNTTQLKLPALIVLDLDLPVMSGSEVLRELMRDSRTREIPVILATAKGEETDQLVGFAAGASDYLVKPYGVKVLIARIAVLLRTGAALRESAESSQVYRSHNVTFDTRRMRITLGAKELNLTPTERDVLLILMQHPGRAFSRQEIMDNIGSGDLSVLDRTIDVHVKSLRNKLSAAGANAEELVQTVRGVGYRWKEVRGTFE